MSVMTMFDLRFEPGTFEIINRLLRTRLPCSVVLTEGTVEKNVEYPLKFGGNFECQSEAL
jgi:hypothetical protein